MPVEIQVTQADIDNMARKLDEFATVLNDRERTLMLGVLGMAGKAIRRIVEAPPKQPTSHASRSASPISTGFRDAFAQSVGTQFRASTPGDAEAISVKSTIDPCEWARG